MFINFPKAHNSWCKIFVLFFISWCVLHLFITSMPDFYYSSIVWYSSTSAPLQPFHHLRVKDDKIGTLFSTGGKDREGFTFSTRQRQQQAKNQLSFEHNEDQWIQQQHNHDDNTIFSSKLREILKKRKSSTRSRTSQHKHQQRTYNGECIGIIIIIVYVYIVETARLF